MNPAAVPYVRMAGNNAWANETLYAALAGNGRQASAGARPGSFPSLMRTLNHIYEVDLYYLDALQQGGRGKGAYDRRDSPKPRELAAAQADADARMSAFCAGLDSILLSATRETDRGGIQPIERFDAILLHLFQHQIHHRGQAHVQMHHAGMAPPQLDEFYLDFDRAPGALAYFG